MKYYVLHIPTGSFLWNEYTDDYWFFTVKRVAEELVKKDSPVNMFCYIKWFKKWNKNIDWDNLQLSEIAIVEKE
jgi:hypothetical protein